MKNILFIMPFLGRTGAERVIFNLVNNIDSKRYRAHILLYSDDIERNTLLSGLNPNIPVNFLNVKGRARYNLHKILFGIRNYCKKNAIDTLLISDGTANAFISPFLFLLGRQVKKIARESNLPSLYEKSFLAKVFYKVFYNNYDVIVVQSDEMLADMTMKMGVLNSKIIKINNPVDIALIKEMSDRLSEIKLSNSKINLLSIGRLTYQKGYDILLDAFSKIKNEDLHLTIVGVGEEKDNLIAQAVRLGLKNNVTFIPSTDNPYALMRNADVFISCSRWEGYPNVVIESIACGTPVLANDYPGGINEILDGENGYICDLKNDLAVGLKYVSGLSEVTFDKEKMSEIYKKYESIY